MAKDPKKDRKSAAAAPTSAADMNRRQQLVETWKMTRRSDPKVGLLTFGAALVAGFLGFLVFYVLPGEGVIGWILAVVGSLLAGSLAAMIVFGRRAQTAAYRQMEGQPGAAAAALRMLRRGWKADPVIAFNKNQDVVHRVVGPPGIVLVGEGTSPTRIKQLLVNEHRKHERVASEIPIHEVVCGNGEGQVPLPKLVRHVQKLGRKVKPAEMTDVLSRLKALDATRSNIPLPKGPIPTSMKGMRGNLRGR